LRRLSKPPFHTSASPETGSKLDSTEAKNTEQAPVKSIEITSIINGLQGIVFSISVNSLSAVVNDNVEQLMQCLSLANYNTVFRNDP